MLKVAAGIAGYGNDTSIRAGIEDVIRKVFPNAFITNDAHFAMISSLDGSEGVYVICGVDSIAFRNWKGVMARKGGFGYLLGD